jgi:hypothetical protein
MKSERDGIDPLAEPSGIGCKECLAHNGTTTRGCFPSPSDFDPVTASLAGHTKPLDGAVVTIDICVLHFSLDAHRMQEFITNAMVEV